MIPCEGVSREIEVDCPRHNRVATGTDVNAVTLAIPRGKMAVFGCLRILKMFVSHGYLVPSQFVPNAPSGLFLKYGAHLDAKIFCASPANFAFIGLVETDS